MDTTLGRTFADTLATLPSGNEVVEMFSDAVVSAPVPLEPLSSVAMTAPAPSPAPNAPANKLVATTTAMPGRLRSGEAAAGAGGAHGFWGGGGRGTVAVAEVAPGAEAVLPVAGWLERGTVGWESVMETSCAGYLRGP